MPDSTLRDRRALRLLWLAAVLLGGCGLFPFLAPAPNPVPSDPAIAALLQPAPRLPIGFYDYFGALKTPAEARQLVTDAGLDPNNPDKFLRIGLVQITQSLIDLGRDRFFNQPLGDPFSRELLLAEQDPPGEQFQIDPALETAPRLFQLELARTLLLRPRIATTNLQIVLGAAITVGSRTYPPGTVIDTGADIAAGESLPVGFVDLRPTCASCHAAVEPLSGKVIAGAPNNDLNIALFLALAPNTASTFLRLNIADVNPLDARFTKTGRKIIDSNGQLVSLPDPIEYERFIDDYLLDTPLGGFEAAADATSAITKIPDCFTFGEGRMGWDGGFRVGPFGGVAALSNAVHALEVNFLAPTQVSQDIGGVDPEVYLGIVFQNYPKASLRLPDGVKPSDWLRSKLTAPERDVLLELSGYPSGSLFSLNGLAFSPRGETFLKSVLALSAFQQSLVCPPNKSDDNRRNHESGAVARGAAVFAAAHCNDCHVPPYFTSGAIIPNDVLKANAARGRQRLFYAGRLAAARVPSFDQTVPLPANPNLLTLPKDEASPDPVSLPSPLSPNGGYKVPGLLGLYLRAPYLHDGGVAVGPDALRFTGDGRIEIVDLDSIGVPGTIKRGRPVSPSNSLRALLDRTLRNTVVTLNGFDPTLTRSNVEGKGHEFWVDATAGYSLQQQSDLIAFLLALDDDPGHH